MNDGYTLYLLSGDSAGIIPGADEDEEDENGQRVVSCTKAEAMGYTCDITTNAAGKQVKQICTELSNYCRTTTYNEDGSYTNITCKEQGNGVCLAATYDKDDNLLRTRICSSAFSENGNCTQYRSDSFNRNRDYIYDEDSHLIKMLDCNEDLTAAGKCNTYRSGTHYVYDGNRLISHMVCEASSIDAQGNCNYSGKVEYLYDTNGKQTGSRVCSGSDFVNGSCQPYSSGYDYVYDQAGNIKYRISCQSIAANGDCEGIRSRLEYEYDSNGNMIHSKQCNTVDAQGVCSEYGTNTAQSDWYIYDDDNHQIFHGYCYSGISATTGECASAVNLSPVVG